MIYGILYIIYYMYYIPYTTLHVSRPGLRPLRRRPRLHDRGGGVTCPEEI